MWNARLLALTFGLSLVGTSITAYAQSASPQSTNAPASAGANLSKLTAFPGPALVLPLDQAPYSNWGFLGAEANTSAGAGTFYTESVGESRQGIGADRISIQGYVGGDTWDQFVPASGCDIATAYCYEPPDPEHRQGGAAEIFGQLTARGNPAYVVHGTFPSELWRLVWFDAAANVTYDLEFVGDDVITLFEPLDTWSQHNVSAAQQLASMADELAVWDGSSVSAATGPGDPADAVQAFYGLLNRGDFEDAWNMYNPRYTSTHSFDDWVKGYATTQSVTVLSATTTSQTDATATVNTTVQSVDKQAGGKLLTQQFQGTWNLVLVDGNWKLDTASIKKIA
jgi:hypothetical protein